MKPDMEPGIHDERIPSDIYWEAKSRQRNVQSWSEKEGKVCISIFSDKCDLNSDLSLHIYKNINRISGFVLKKMIFLLILFFLFRQHII